MSEPRRDASRNGPERSPEELARLLKAKARSAAVGALREGLEEIEGQYGQHVADEVAGLVDVTGVFAGLDDHAAGTGADSKDDDGPWELKSLSAR
ncbi:hypothetical protein [Amycolatopsis saalfeldensis]|uniref:Uncharacterized protein n=1 Tax=Amycolatopsis saalfeldensis TaxID=394193 RepID=A0A1H8SUB2_9PSEU|nr:hypothetical protein [Amycolatopsis saalfeldensis]SEO82177.1 hypothetical protein SAMN04489732_102284 [Amycolatopsis saalfeldensis]